MTARPNARSTAAGAVLAIVSSLMVLWSAPPADAEGPTILGAGSTWSQIAIDQWRSDVNRLGLSVNYQGVGSTTGRQFFAAGTVDFGVSEIPFQPDDPNVTRSFKYLPIVAGGTSMMYNLRSASGAQIRDLRLAPDTIADIFTGKITNWNDPQVRRDYGSTLPNTPIKVVVRSDGSGTSAQFSAYIAAEEGQTWASFAHQCGIPNQYTSFWPYGMPGCLPNAIGQRGSDGVANYVANPGLGVGAVGYVEAGYAIARRFPVVAVRNSAGNFSLPTAYNVATALQHARLNPDSTQELSQVYAAPEGNAYPISSYSYMIVPTDSSISQEKGEVLGKFIIYFACTGQRAAQRLGYSPMPKPLVEFAFAAEKQIPGAPDPPPVDGEHCNNPTLTGEFKPGEGGGNGSGVIPGTDPNAGGEGSSSGGGSGSGSGLGSGSGSGSGSGLGFGAGSGSGSGAGAGEGAAGASGSVVVVTQTPAVIPDSQLAALKRAADERILGMRPLSATPLFFMAALLLALVFAPILLRIRRRGGGPP